MPEPTEFEEKEYEQPLNIELLLHPQNDLWSPGQVLERHFGFDVALFTAHIQLWSLFGYSVALPGVILDSFTWGDIWQEIGRKRALPRFRTNLFLQIKRPEHRLGGNSTYARMGISGQYWQFAITIHQQGALERVARRLKNRGAICYACPAFHKLSDLYSHQANRRLVATSTFVQAYRLTGHAYWLYDSPGGIGIAHSDPVQIEDIGIEGLLGQLRDGDDVEDGDNPLQNLLRMEDGIVGSINEIDEYNPLAVEFKRRKDIITSIRDLGLSNTNYSAIQAFSNN